MVGYWEHWVERVAHAEAVAANTRDMAAESLSFHVTGQAGRARKRATGYATLGEIHRDIIHEYDAICQRSAKEARALLGELEAAITARKETRSIVDDLRGAIAGVELGAIGVDLVVEDSKTDTHRRRKNRADREYSVL